MIGTISCEPLTRERYLHLPSDHSENHGNSRVKIAGLYPVLVVSVI